jgi:hypothetical protein
VTRPASRQFARSRNVLTAMSIGGAGVVLAACGATPSNGSLSIPSVAGGILSTPSGAVGPTSGNLGDTLSMVDLGEDVAHVTLVKVFDPATGYDPNTTPPDGTRWVGFEGTIVVDGSRAGEDATSFDVIGSDGQTYGTDTAYFLSVFDGCTASDGDDIKSGQTQTFCSAVGLPPGVTVAKVGYSTEGVNGNAPSKLLWTVSDAGPSPSPTATATPTPDGSAPTESPTPAGSAPTESPTPDGSAPTASPTPTVPS